MNKLRKAMTFLTPWAYLRATNGLLRLHKVHRGLSRGCLLYLKHLKAI